MKRRRNGRSYTVLPGGGVEAGELPTAAVLRELEEETGLSGHVSRHLVTRHHEDRTAHYFEVIVDGGFPVLGGPEALAQSADNIYEPVWLEIRDLDHEPLVPDVARDIIDLAIRSKSGVPK